MPVSHKGRFVFIHVPKAAGTSAVESFREAGLDLDFMGVNLWHRLAATERRTELLKALREVFPVNTVVGFAEQHLPAIVLREFLHPNLWSSYFKFAFVRNPWDLVVSMYHFFRQTPAAVASDPDYRFVVENLDFENFVYLYPTLTSDMSAMFTNANGETLVDYVGRFENIEEDFAKICARIGIDAKLPHLNSSARTSYRDYYTSASRAVVERHFARDIERFGYEF
jgi:hypothetical protein